MGHSGERSRGDSRIRDWPDVEWRLVRQDEEPASARYISAYGRDVDVVESALLYDPTSRHLTVVGGSRRDAAIRAALRDVTAVLEKSSEPLNGRAIELALEGSEHPRATIRRALALGIRREVIKPQPGPTGRPCTPCRNLPQCPIPVRRKAAAHWQTKIKPASGVRRNHGWNKPRSEPQCASAPQCAAVRREQCQCASAYRARRTQHAGELTPADEQANWPADRREMWHAEEIIHRVFPGVAVISEEEST